MWRGSKRRSPSRLVVSLHAVRMALRRPLDGARAGDDRRHLLFLVDLPVDELLDVRVIEVQAHHLRGAARGPARLDGAGSAVADAEEAHQPGRPAAAGEALTLAAQAGEVRARPGAVLEEAGLTRPQIHDPAVVDEVVGDGLDEAGVGLRALVAGRGRLHLARALVEVVVTLRRAVDPVGPVQAGVEPLRRVRRADLGRQHVAELVVERAGVLLGGEEAVLPAPVGPAAGEALEDLRDCRAHRRTVGPPAGPRGPPRPRPGARARRGSPSPRPACGARGRPPCGSTSGQGCRRRPGSTPPAPSRPLPRTRGSRPGSGSRSGGRRTPSRRRGSAFLR